MENTVEKMLMESAPDDAAQASSENLSELTAPKQTQEAQPSEPGWIKKRVDAAVEKAVARVTAEYEERLAPLRESLLDREASDLVASGEFKSIEMAKKYVRAVGGVSAAQQPSAPVAQKGETDPVIAARADLLAKQAQKIKSKQGVDVVQIFQNDAAVHQRVLSGEWDFYDVAEHAAKPAPQKKVPVPSRSANGGVETVSIANMTDAQFKQLRENLRTGKRYDMRK